MKQVNLFFLIAIIGIMVTTSCSTENSEQLQVNSIEDTKGRIDRYEKETDETWYINVTINDVTYTEVKGLVAEQVAKVASGEDCTTCRCFYNKKLNANTHLVDCDSGHSYFAVNCYDGTGWHVYSADPVYIGHGMSELPSYPPC